MNTNQLLGHFRKQLEATPEGEMPEKTSVYPYHQIVESAEKPIIKMALKHFYGNQSQAAKWLGINRATLRNRILRYELSY